LEEQDTIAGKKIENQKIPYRIDIKLKLPKDYLVLLKEEVDSAVWDSINPKPVKPEELSDQELKLLKQHEITLEQYTQEYNDLMEHFGEEKPIW
jgi:hypothetical protein